MRPGPRAVVERTSPHRRRCTPSGRRWRTGRSQAGSWGWTPRGGA